jgi:hypothetical protein
MREAYRILLWSGAILPLFALAVRVDLKDQASVQHVSDDPTLHSLSHTLSQGAQVSPSAGPFLNNPSALVSQAAAPDDLASRLKLLGTGLTPEPAAWIQDRVTHQTGLYRKGEAILDARLAFIGSGMVWLERDGTLTQLRLEGSPSVTVTDRLSSGSVTDRPGSGSVDASLVRIPTPEGPFNLQMVIGEGGSFSGLSVESLEGARWLKRLGLQEGDLILAINGQRLVTPQQAAQVIRKAMHQPSPTLTLQRAE